MLELIDGRNQQTPVHIPRPRPVGAVSVDDDVARIVADVRSGGDATLYELGGALDGLAPGTALAVDADEIADALDRTPADVVDALRAMADRLRTTCERQLPREWFGASPGAPVGEMVRPLRRVGIYAPGGRGAYPSTVVMAAVPARVAGVAEIAVCSPGGPAEPVLAACAVLGITEVYRIGGAQAIAAMAFGTGSVRPVDKIVGPGNVYVTAAKRAVRGWVGTDTDAGPTELAVVADAGADPVMVAADLVAQAEHGPHGSHVLITWDEPLVRAVTEALEHEVAMHPSSDDVENALIEGGVAVLVRDRAHAFDTANAFAPEHLELLVDDLDDALARVQSAGSVFAGVSSPVPAGDYGGGTNHVLPTGGAARHSSGLGTADFVKRIYVTRYDESALQEVAADIVTLAEAEGLDGHARAVQLRTARSRGTP